MLICCLLSIILSCLINCEHKASSELNTQLLQVIAIACHGGSAPSNKIPSLPCQKLEQDTGAITKQGAKENWNLGNELHNSYSTIIGAYDSNKHKFFAANSPDTLMSGQTIFQGLYHGTFETSTPYPSGSIYTETRALDNVFLYNETCGEALSREREHVTKSDAWNSKISENEGFFKTVTSEGRFSEQVTMNNIEKASEQIKEAIHHGATGAGDQCVFANNTINEKLIELSKWKNKMLNNPEDVDIAKMQMTPFIQKIYPEIEKRMESYDAYNFLMFVGSPSNLLAALQLFGQADDDVPYGSVFFIEVHNINSALIHPPVPESQIRLRVGYRKYDVNTQTLKSYDDDGERIRGKEEESGWNLSPTVCGGKQFCTLEQLRNLTFTMEEWKRRCEVARYNEIEPETKFSFTTKEIVVIAIVGGLLFIALVVLFVFLIRNFCLNDTLKKAGGLNDEYGLSVKMKD